MSGISITVYISLNYYLSRVFYFSNVRKFTHWKDHWSVSIVCADISLSSSVKFYFIRKKIQYFIQHF